MPMTATAENRVLNWLLTTSAPTRPTTWYVALHVGASGAAGASNEITGNGYARQPITAFNVSGNVASNPAQLSFGPNTTANWGTVTDATVWDSITAGTCLLTGTVTTPVAYAVGDTATFAAGALTFTLV